MADAENQNPEEEGDSGDPGFDERDQCPECGAFYQITVRAPNPPSIFLEYATDAEIEAWEDEHDYNIAECLCCGWRSDEEG